jgi:hypothetical protein
VGIQIPYLRTAGRRCRALSLRAPMAAFTLAQDPVAKAGSPCCWGADRRTAACGRNPFRPRCQQPPRAWCCNAVQHRALAPLQHRGPAPLQYSAPAPLRHRAQDTLQHRAPASLQHHAPAPQRSWSAVLRRRWRGRLLQGGSIFTRRSWREASAGWCHLLLLGCTYRHSSSGSVAGTA